MVSLRLLIAGTIVAQLLAIPTMAAADPPTAGKAVEKEVKICENIVLTGSRLATHRYCATKEEWAQRRLEDRQTVERMQLTPCVATTTNNNGHPVC